MNAPLVEALSNDDGDLSSPISLLSGSFQYACRSQNLLKLSISCQHSVPTKKCRKLATVVRVLQNKHNLFSLHRCLTEDSTKCMHKDYNARTQQSVVIKPFVC